MKICMLGDAQHVEEAEKMGLDWTTWMWSLSKSSTRTRSSSKSLPRIKFQLKKVLCMGVAVGNLSMEEKQIFQNVQMSVNFLVSLLKKNWQNVCEVFVPQEHNGTTSKNILSSRCCFNALAPACVNQESLPRIEHLFPDLEKMSQNGKLIPPNMDQNSTRLLNLTVLQRLDPFIEEILITAAHVTFYEFNIEISQWSRKDVEGSLFVVKRNKQPRFQFIVMNRRNTDNLVEDLLGDFEYEVQGPYLLYRNASQEVNGIWFYNKRECEEVARLFDRLLSAYSKANQKPNTSSPKSEFEELEAVPTMAVMDGPLEPSSTARDAPNDPAFVNFFSSAMALGNTSSGQTSGPPYQQPSAIPLQPHQPTLAPPAATAAPPQILSPPPLQSSSPMMPLFDNNPDLISNKSNVHTDLVTPSSFFGPPRMMAQPHLIPGSSMPTTNATHQQRPYGTPMLQPFPPPTPPASLAPAHSGPVINRDKVKEALLSLVQENEFIDMVTRALQNAHQP
ncbi:unnamed protein product [Brassica napus]|uniref:(rape) hypothetical protein n=1 Tax=Brassica napus TaxID=3708 RepID=A0A816KMX2_BRANA|nr:unnamed protein product [Brassica napus]